MSMTICTIREEQSNAHILKFI